MASLDDPRARVRRAKEHLDLLYERLAAFADRDPYSVIGKPDTDAGVEEPIFTLREQPPPELGLLLSDALHNLRAALDNLVWQVVALDGGTPDENTGFPVTGARQQFRSQAGSKLKGMSNPHIAVIEKLQPYPGRDGPGPRAVEAVHEYARRDRHRVIHPVFAVLNPDPSALYVRREPVTAEFQVRVEYVGAGKPLEDGATIARLTSSAAEPQPSVKMEVEFPIEIAFGEQGLSAKALPAIWREIDRIVEGFAADFR
jgi:hypothetical protein